MMALAHASCVKLITNKGEKEQMRLGGQSNRRFENLQVIEAFDVAYFP